MQPQVDMLALSKEEQKVAEGLFALKDLYGSVPPDNFFWKATTVFAYRLFAVDGVDEGMAVLALVPPEYFAGPALEHMEDDPLYAELTKRIADKVLEAGKVPPPLFEFDAAKTAMQHTVGRA